MKPQFRPFRFKLRGKTLITGDAPGGNYEAKMFAFAQEHPEIRGGVHHVNCLHDEWCDIYRGRPCNCNPEIEYGGPHEPATSN